MRTLAAAVVMAACSASGVTRGAGQSPERRGPLSALPSRPGPHVDKIKALKDNSWLELGPPTADPKWGRARGRSWTSQMPLAAELPGAFLHFSTRAKLFLPGDAPTCVVPTTRPRP